MRLTEDTSNRLLRALNYPYWRPRHSYLYAGGDVVELASTCVTDLKQSRVAGRDVSLAEYFRMTGLAGEELDRPRTALLAHGSNASPIQLSIKFSGEQNSVTFIPVLKGILRNYTPVYAAQFSPYGAVPATLARIERCQSDVHIALLTDDQLEKLNRSEGLGDRYELISLPDATVTLPDGSTFESPPAYIATGGALFARGTYWRLPTGQADTNALDSAVDQRTVQKIIMQLLDDERDVEEFIVELLNDPKLRLKRNHALRAHSRMLADTLPRGLGDKY